MSHYPQEQWNTTFGQFGHHFTTNDEGIVKSLKLIHNFLAT